MRIVASILVLGAALSADLLWADEPNAAVVRAVLKLSPEIDCPSCEDGIKHTLVTARGVKTADINVLTNRITLSYDPSLVTLKALIGRIRVIGYNATETK